MFNKLFKKYKKKYTMIVFDADERYEQEAVDPSFFVDYPEEGLLVDVVYGDTYEELIVDPSNEGYYYLLYSNETGRRIGSGIVDDSIEDEIHENCKT